MPPARSTLANGHPVLFGFAVSSDEGPYLVVGDNVAVGQLVDLSAQAHAHFMALWRSALEAKTKDLGTGPTPEPSRILKIH